MVPGYREAYENLCEALDGLQERIRSNVLIMGQAEHALPAVPRIQPSAVKPSAPRYKPPPCPKCGKKSHVTWSPRRGRTLKCGSRKKKGADGCGHTWQEGKSPHTK